MRRKDRGARTAASRKAALVRWRKDSHRLWIRWWVIIRGINPRSTVVNSWARFDDATVNDPRMLGLANNLPARVLFYEARIWCARELTDGKIPDSVILGLCRGFEKVTEASVDALVSVKLWRRHPDGDGWEDIEFLKLHKTRVQVLADRAKKQKAGALGGHSTQAKALAVALANAEAGADEDLGHDEEWLARVIEGGDE